MREWSLTSHHLPSLTIAADARLAATEYFNDHIWELSLGGGDPAALALETTFGLRARGFRLFLRFHENDHILVDPEEYLIPPTVKRFFPNYLLLYCSPFEGIDVDIEYWVPESNAISSRVRTTNRDTSARQIQLELDALLTPNEKGERMAPVEIQATTVLSGKTGDLCPLVFLTGGPVVASGPFPGLALIIDLPPEGSRHIVWAQAALSTVDASFNLARQTASRNWEAERAKVAIVNASQVEVMTGDQAWDLAFAISQKIALGLFIGPTDQLPHPSFVNNRLPDQGFSIRGDGSDYGHIWSGQNPLDTYYLINLILLGAPSLAQNIITNFLSTQTEDGFIDWKPGLGGQRSKRLATPLLATMAWQMYEVLEDPAFLDEYFPALVEFFFAWFTPQRDRDEDGVPEWDHPLQAGFDDHPLFARWQTWAQGVDITTVESPSLSSFLYRESQALIQIADLVGQTEYISELKKIADNLHIAVGTSWDQEHATYSNRDRDTHETTPSVPIGERRGSGPILIHENYGWPVRLLVQVNSSTEATRRPIIFIHGRSASGSHKVERISLERFQWYLGWGTATSEYTYSSLEQIEVQGLEEGDDVLVQSVDLTSQDQTLLIPLWAGIPSSELAEDLITNTITSPEYFWYPYGISACPRSPTVDEVPACQNIHMPWNLLIGEGMLDYGYQREAAELVTRLMKAVTKCLKEEGNFFRYYNRDTGRGSSDRDVLSGLAPLGLFLKVLGIKIKSPHKVELSGDNPFPWSVTVKYRGLTILRQKEKTLVTFPDGQSIEISSPEPQVIALA